MAIKQKIKEEIKKVESKIVPPKSLPAIKRLMNPEDVEKAPVPAAKPAKPLFNKGDLMHVMPNAVMCEVDHSTTTLMLGNSPICMKCLEEKVKNKEIVLQVM